MGQSLGRTHRTQAGSREILTCRWSRGRRGFRFGFHSFFCHNTDCNVGKRRTDEKEKIWGNRQAACTCLSSGCACFFFNPSDTLSPPFLVNRRGVCPTFWPCPARFSQMRAAGKRGARRCGWRRENSMFSVFVLVLRGGEGVPGGWEGGKLALSPSFCLPLIVKLLCLERMQDATFNQDFCGAIINYQLKKPPSVSCNVPMPPFWGPRRRFHYGSFN